MISASSFVKEASQLCRWEVVCTRDGLSVSEVEARLPPTAQGNELTDG